MLGTHEFVGPTLAVIMLLVFLGGLAYFVLKDIRSFSIPNTKSLDIEIEKRSNLPRGHISMLQDTLANPKKHITRDLWKNAQNQILHSFNRLKSPNVRATLSRKDPSALRYIAILVFISGIMTAGPLWSSRIMSGVFPMSPHMRASEGKMTGIWIKPPEYTQMPSIHITGGSLSEAINIPEDSEITIRTHSMFGTMFAPTLQNGDKAETLTYLDEGQYELKTTINPNGNRLVLKQFFIPRSSWPYNFIKDNPPEIRSGIKNDEATKNTDTTEQQELSEAPKDDITPDQPAPDSEENTASEEHYEMLDKAQIRFPLTVKDDYSVKELSMTMDLDEMVIDRPLGDPVNETRLIMSEPNADFKIAPIYDLAWHTWAGLPVTFEYSAIDHKGQHATLEKIHLVLPEREFEHPMAKSLIAVRKRIAWDYKDSFHDIAVDLESLLLAPEYLQDNPVTYLAIRIASSRLYYNDNAPDDVRIAAAKDVINILWYAAISIEDGNLAMAMHELRDAQRALENAMRDPKSSSDEIARLMENLREKMQNYFAEMQREMQKRIENGENFPELSMDDFSDIISPDTLSQLMEDIEKALREGDEQKAQELMSQLQRMMEMMDPSMQPNLPSDMQAMKEGVNELQELIERQEQLLEQTEKQAQAMGQVQKPRPIPDSIKRNPVQPPPSIQDMLKDFGFDSAPPKPQENKQEDQDTASQQDGSSNEAPSEKSENTKNNEGGSDKSGEINTQANKAEQEALRYVLGQLMMDAAEKIDEVPESMGLAEQEMRGSEDKLAQNDPAGSVPHQEQAIEHLKDAQENLAKQFRQRMQQMIGIGLSGGQRYDPLGRPYGGQDDPNGRSPDSRVKVPDEAQKKRVDEILRELRERSGDRSRSREELEYLRRLLRQF